jgi:hypothetical protein
MTAKGYTGIFLHHRPHISIQETVIIYYLLVFVNICVGFNKKKGRGFDGPRPDSLNMWLTN